ncbi:MAG: DsbA family protein [Planctomycetota bacterium]
MSDATVPIAAYVDFVSPFSWLAVARLRDIEARSRLRFQLKPILLAVLLDHHGLVAAGEVKAKRDHELRRIAWRASELGLDFEVPPRHPFVSLRSLRTAALYQGGDQMLSVCRELFAACWERGEDLTRGSVVESVLIGLGIDTSGLEDWVGSSTAKELVKANTAEALEAGAFGVPSFVTPDGLVFWGQDQLDRLEQWAMDELPEPSPALERAMAMSVAQGRVRAPRND